MEQSEDLLGTDVATARAIVTVRKATTTKGALTHGEQDRTCKISSTPGRSEAEFHQQQMYVVSAAAVETAEVAAGSSQLLGVQPKGASGSATLDLCKGTQSASPQSVSTANNDAIGKAHNVHAVLRHLGSHSDKREKQQKAHAQLLPGTQQQQDELKQAADQALAHLVQLRELSASKLTADVSSLVSAEQGAAAYEQTGPNSASKLPAKKRGRPSNKDKKPTLSPCQLPGMTEQIGGVGAAAWPILQQQQFLQNIDAAASPPSQLRRKPGRPPKSVNSVMALAEQQGEPINRLSSAGCYGASLDEPYKASIWPAALGGLQSATSHHAHQQQASAEMSTWSEAGVEATTAPGAGMRTRLSMRSVAYLEDLLEQTAQAAASTGGTSTGQDVQAAGRASGRSAAMHLGAAGSGRLSVGNLIISPPMSRASSMYQAAAGSSPPKVSPAVAGAQVSKVAAKPLSPATEIAATGQKMSTTAATNPGMAPADPVAGECPRSPASPRLQQQHQSSSLLVGQGPDDSHRAENHNMAVPNTGGAPDGQCKGNGADEISTAAAAAGVTGVAAWQQAAAVSTTCHASEDSLSSSGEEECDQDAEVWVDTAGGRAGAANKCATSRRACSSSDTCSSPSSGSPVSNPCLAGAFTAANGSAAIGVAHGLLYGGLLQSFGGAPAALLQNPAVVAGGASCASALYGPAGCPRKSDRQVGLETVQVIDAIFQQRRSLQAGQSASIPAQHTPIDSSAPAAPQQHMAAEGADTPPATDGALAEGQEVAGDDRCTVAALCRGLRFDGDITLKEVAMAFQLRDAYDWDEDLEAAGKEDKEVEDPRLKGPKLLSHSPSASNSSVCPDPEPVPGFLHRSTWMAGNGREGASPISSKVHQSGLHLGHEFHLGAVAAGLPPALLQRLHNQSFTGLGSQPGSITSSRRASFAGSPVNTPGQEGGGCWQQQLGQAPAPAALHAAICTAAQQHGPRGWVAMMPGVDTEVQAHPQMHPSSVHGMQPHPYMPIKAPGRGYGRGRKRKNTDNSDDDYDPRKPSHQQEVYQRKHIDRRTQQHQQPRTHNCMSGYGYSYQAMQQAYSAAATQQAYILQAASRSGAGFSMQQLQHLQQLHYMQQHAQMAMAALEEQAAAAAAANGCAPSAAYGCVRAASAAPAAANIYMQSPVNSVTHITEQQTEKGQHQQQQGVQQLQSGKPPLDKSGQPVVLQQQPQQSLLGDQPTQQQQSTEVQQQQPVRRPSYVKRRLTADDAADWLQSHAPDGLQFRRQLEAPRSALGRAIDHMAAAEQDQGLQILSPTTVKPPSSFYGQPLAPTAPEGDRPLSRNGGRVRRRTLAGLQYDVIHGHVCEIPVGPSEDTGSDDDVEIESDVSDPEVGYSAGSRGGRRGGRGGRGRGRGCRGRGRGTGRTSSAPSMPPAGSLAPAFQATESAAPLSSAATSSSSPAVHSVSRGRGRGRGRLGAGRGRSCLSSVALAADPAAASGPSAAAGTVQQQLSRQPTLVAPAAAAGPPAGGTVTAVTDAPHGSLAAPAAGVTAPVTLSAASQHHGGALAGRGRGRGRAKGRGRAISAVPASSAEIQSAPADWSDSNTGMAPVAGVSAVDQRLSAGGRRGRGSARGRGRLVRPPPSSFVAGSPTPCDRAIAAAFPQQHQARESGAARGSALYGLQQHKKQKLSSVVAQAARMQQQTAGPKEGLVEQSLSSMAALPAAGLVQQPQVAVFRAESTHKRCPPG